MAFQTFSGLDYLKIDIANNWGLDKEDWDVRLDWFEANEHQLHSLLAQAEEPALYYAGLVAYEKALAGKPSGYPISLDATASGIQILAALSCDRKAAALCNVIDAGKRNDVYTLLYQSMADRVEMEAENPNLRRMNADGTMTPVRYKIDRKLTKQAIN